MSKKSQLKSEPEEEFGEGPDFKIPGATRRCITIPLLILILLIIILYLCVIFGKSSVDVSKLGIPELFMISIVVVTVVNIPWDKLGFRIKKIGTIELEQVVKGQARSNSQELADLQKQIDELKNLFDKPKTNVSEETLDEIVIKFLSTKRTTAFSALRIYNIAKNLEGFEKLNNYTTRDVRESLRRLLASGKVVTRISKKGNTIYKIA